MSQLETDKIPFQDDLPPEVIRRLQVEELWARRQVLAELMNAERFKTYNARRALMWPPRFPAMDVVWRDASARPSATVVPIKNKKALAPGQ
jgi:hypothetical protein